MAPEPRLPSRGRNRRSALLALLLLCVLPSFLLREALFEGRRFLPFDLSTFPPASCALTPDEIAARRAPGNDDITEKSVICTPEYRFAREELLEGRLPHWNPYVRGGAPLFASALDGFAYPFHLPLLLLDPDRAYGLVAWLDFVMAGVFMLGFLRSIGLGWLAATFGAVCFQLSGTLAANAHFFMRMEPLLWLPAGFWALERLHHTRGAQRFPPLAGFALSLGFCWLAGFPPYAFAITLAFGLYALALLRRTHAQLGTRAALHFASFAALAGTLGLGIAMVQIVPALDYFPESQRRIDQSLRELVAQGLDPSGFLGLLVPRPFSSPIHAEAVPPGHNPLLYLHWSLRDPETGQRLLPFASWNFTEYAVYIGALPLIAALIGALRASVRFRWFALFALLVFGLLATAGPLFELAWQLPVFRSTPPFRYAALLGFFLAALAAMGFEVGTEGLRRRGALLVLALTLVALGITAWVWHDARTLAADPEAARAVAQTVHAGWKADYPKVAGDLEEVVRVLGAPSGDATHPDWTRFAFARLAAQLPQVLLLLGLGVLWLVLGRLRVVRQSVRLRTSLRVVVLLVVAFDLFVAARHLNPSFPRRDTTNTTVHRFLREQREAHREQGGFMVARISQRPEHPSQLLPNTLVPDRIRDLNAYAFVDRNSHQPFHRLYGDEIKLGESFLHSFPVDERLQHPLFDLYGVRFLLAERRFEELGAPALPPLQGPGGEFWVYERPTTLPRAFLVRQARIEEDPLHVLGYLTGKDLAPRELVLLSERYGEAAEGIEEGLFSPDTKPEDLNRATVRFTRDDPGRIQILVRDSPGAWLFVSDTAMRNWHLLRNGSDAPWWRAHLAFRACWVPPGDHELTWTYDSWPFRLGLWMTAASLAILLLLLIWWTGAPQRPRRDTEIVDLSSS